jgi:hypothetical protein
MRRYTCEQSVYNAPLVWFFALTTLLEGFHVPPSMSGHRLRGVGPEPFRWLLEAWIAQAVHPSDVDQVLHPLDVAFAGALELNSGQRSPR